MSLAWEIVSAFALSLYRGGEFFTGILMATAVCWVRWRWRR